MNTQPGAGTFSAQLEQQGPEQRLLHGLEFLWLEITGKCNLQCVHCYADSSPHVPLVQAMCLDDWKEAISQAHILGCRNLQFIGGEPTLHPGLCDLILYAHSLGFQFIEVFTNGTALTPRLREVIKRCHVNLAFSVYSLDPVVHDSVTLRGGSQHKTLAGVRWALEAGLPVRAAIIDVGLNSSSVADTQSFLQRLGVTSIGIDRLRGIGRGARHSSSELLLHELCGRCWEGKLCVTSSGAIYPCVFSRFTQVGSFSEGLAAVLDGAKLLTFRSALQSQILAGIHSDTGPDPTVKSWPAVGPSSPECRPGTPAEKCDPDFEPPGGCDPSHTCQPRYPCQPKAGKPPEK